MKRPRSTTKSLLAAALGLSIGVYAPSALATDYTFTGTGNWYDTPTNSNWTPAPSPGLLNNTLDVTGNNATILGAVNYNAGAAGGDFLLGHGDTMTVDGGSWTQAVGVGNWVKIGGTAGIGTVIVRNGGSFNENDSGARLRLGQDGGTGIITVESSAGSGGLHTAGLTELSSASTINLQGGSNSFAQIIAQGTINVSGGTTTMSGALTTSATTAINISGGSFTNTGNGTVFLDPSATFQLSGNGAFAQSGTGEFQPGATGSTQGISGNATLNIAGLVAFQGGATQKFNISGGSLTLGASGFNGIYSNGGYFNFTLNSTGSILFTNTGAGEQNIFENQIRYNDTTYTIATYDSVFDVTHPTATSTLITLDSLTPIPEPSSVAGSILLGLGGLFAAFRYRRRRLA